MSFVRLCYEKARSVGWYYSSVAGKFRTQKHSMKSQSSNAANCYYICFQLKGKHLQVLRKKDAVLLQQREPKKQPKSTLKYQGSYDLVRVN